MLEQGTETRARLKGGGGVQSGTWSKEREAKCLSVENVCPEDKVACKTDLGHDHKASGTFCTFNSCS